MNRLEDSIIRAAQIVALAVSDFREAMGVALLSWAFKVLPLTSTTRDGILRGLREQREYDRYAAFTHINGGTPFHFSNWREIQATMHARAASRCKVRDTSHIYMVREKAA